MLPTLRYRQGENLDERFTGDADAVTVSITIKESVSDALPLLVDDDTFVDGEAYLNTLVDIPSGGGERALLYQITYIYEDGRKDKYPKAQDCEGDECAFGEFILCPSLDDEAS
jgi:hypothetical protein